MSKDSRSPSNNLLGKGVRCIRCGEPVWMTLGELLDASGIADKDEVLRQLNAFLGDAGEP